MHAVYIGRFQPPHAGHLRAMQAALAGHGHLRVLLGSANLARSWRNPWRWQERAGMIRAALTELGEDARRVSCAPLDDEYDAGRWAAEVRRLGGEQAALVGFAKDASSRYLSWFPGWTLEESPVTPGLSATDLRAAYFGGRQVESVPDSVQAALRAFAATPAYARLVAEYRAVQAELAAWDGLPRRELLTLDVQHGRVRLTTSPGPIGAGLWALPGRLLATDEAPPTGARLFDHPLRSVGVPAAAYVSREESPGEPVPLAGALAQPRRFLGDHHVILRRMLAA